MLIRVWISGKTGSGEDVRGTKVMIRREDNDTAERGVGTELLVLLDGCGET